MLTVDKQANYISYKVKTMSTSQTALLYKLINNVSAYILPENVNTAAEMVLSRSDKRKY